VESDNETNQPKNCCHNRCLRKFSVERIEQLWEMSKKRSRRATKSFLSNQIKHHLKWNEKRNKFDLDLYQDGLKICQKSFMKLHRVSNYLLEMVKKDILKNKHSAGENLFPSKTVDTVRKSTAISAIDVFLSENS